MTDVTEHALEYVIYGIIFYMAMMMLLWLHGSFMQLTEVVGTSPNRVIMFEKEG